MNFVNILGYTEVGGSTSDVLQKVQLDIISNQQCSTLYNDDDNYRIFTSQICAGVLAGGKDTCGGGLLTNLSLNFVLNINF